MFARLNGPRGPGRVHDPCLAIRPQETFHLSDRGDAFVPRCFCPHLPQAAGDVSSYAWETASNRGGLNSRIASTPKYWSAGSYAKPFAVPKC